MTDGITPAMREQAIDWHLRLETADAADWIAFTEWLEADPAHNAAYDHILAEEEAFDTVLPVAAFPTPGEKEEPVPVARPRWRWGALAASVLAAGLATFQFTSTDDSYAVETQPGETRVVALAGGGKIALNGGTRVVLDKGDPRAVELVSGEARFSVQHDPAHPFAVTIGDDRLVDIGTVFNVARESGGFEVGVSEGSVRYETGGQTVELHPGDVLTNSAGGARVASHSPKTIGSWADGALVYEGATLGDVARDLSRATGKQVTAAPELAARRFSGVIQTTGGIDAIRKRAAAVLGVSIETTQDGWTLTS